MKGFVEVTRIVHLANYDERRRIMLNLNAVSMIELDANSQHEHRVLTSGTTNVSPGDFYVSEADFKRIITEIKA